LAKNKTITMEIFRGGKQTDSAGNSKEWTEADLDAIVNETNKVGEDVPLTIGHAKEDGPAWAWGKKIFREGLSLFAEVSDITDELGIMFKKKMFKNRSIALRANKSMRHIAMLGAAAPAVKGLEAFKFNELGIDLDKMAAFSFNENDSDFVTQGEVEFSDGEFSNEKSFTAKVKEALISLNHNFQENKPQLEDLEMDQIKELESKIEELTNNFSEFKTESEGKIEGLEGEVKTANEAKDAAVKEFSEYKENEVKAGLLEWTESQIEAGKILPADKDSMVSMLVSMNGQESQEFAEGEEKVRKTPLDMFKASIESKESIVEFGETYNDGVSSDRNADGDKLVEMANARAKEKGVSFGEAMRQINDENPSLTQKHA